jgi:hypothetical protein
MDIAIIITTFAGGMLAVIGGFLAIYLMQFMVHRTEQQKLIREKSEELYTLINEIEDKIHLSAIEISYSSKSDELAVEARIATVKLFTEVSSYINKIEMIANLHIRDAIFDTNIYCDKLKEIIAQIIASLDNNADIDLTVLNAFTEIETAHKKIQVTLVKINTQAQKSAMPFAPPH